MARYSISWILKKGSSEQAGTYSGIEAKNETEAREIAMKRLNQNHAKLIKEGYQVTLKVK